MNNKQLDPWGHPYYDDKAQQIKAIEAAEKKKHDELLEKRRQNKLQGFAKKAMDNATSAEELANIAGQLQVGK